MNKPTLHKPVPMNVRVMVPEHYGKGRPIYGQVVGIAMTHIIFTYIVLLDKPLQSEYGPQNAIVIAGPELVSEDGLTNWKIGN